MQRWFAYWLFIAVLWLPIIAAQTVQLNGRVIDRSGAVIPGAKIIATNEATQVSISTTTDDTGAFSLRVPAGLYTVSAELSGFARAEIRHVKTTPKATASITVRLGRGPTAKPPPKPPSPPPAPPPPPQVSPASPPAPPPAPPSIEQAPVWNSWLENQSSPGIAVDRVKRGESYVVSFDLSPYAYDLFVAGAATAQPDDELATALARAGARLTARAYALLAGEGLEFSPGFVPAQPIAFRTDRLRSPAPPRSSAETFETFQTRVSAGRIDVRVDAVSSGCAAVGLSIWTASAQPRPLDYLSRRVIVLDDQGVAPPCSATVSATLKPMTAQLVGLLAADSGVAPDAALHVFAMDLGTGASRPVSYAVFVSGRTWTTWRLSEDLSGFIVDQNSLLRTVAEAHQGKGYQPLIHALTDVIFPPANTSAQKALAVLRALPVYPRPTVFTRLVDLTGTARVLPLGLVDAGDGSPLGARVTVNQPLPRERVESSPGCIASWTMVLPEAFDSDVTDTCRAPAPTSAMRKWPEFQAYLRESSPPSKAEGLLLLAHHASGTISFVQSGSEWARPTNIARQFAPGSVAVMVACNAAADANQYGDSSWPSSLNARGVDAEIVSPFEVPTDFGVCFARHLATEINASIQASSRLSLAELYQQTANAVREDYTKSTLATYQAMADAVYEFVLAGNSAVTTCPQPIRP